MSSSRGACHASGVRLGLPGRPQVRLPADLAGVRRSRSSTGEASPTSTPTIGMVEAMRVVEAVGPMPSVVSVKTVGAIETVGSVKTVGSVEPVGTSPAAVVPPVAGMPSMAVVLAVWCLRACRGGVRRRLDEGGRRHRPGRSLSLDECQPTKRQHTCNQRFPKAHRLPPPQEHQDRK